MIEASKELSRRERYQEMLPFFQSTLQSDETRDHVSNSSISSYKQRPFWPVLIKRYSSGV